MVQKRTPFVSSAQPDLLTEFGLCVCLEITVTNVLKSRLGIWSHLHLRYIAFPRWPLSPDESKCKTSNLPSFL